MNANSSMPKWRVCFDIPACCDAIYRESESDALATLRDIYDGWLESAHIDGTINDDGMWNDMICDCTCWIERLSANHRKNTTMTICGKLHARMKRTIILNPSDGRSVNRVGYGRERNSAPHHKPLGLRIERGKSYEQGA